MKYSTGTILLIIFIQSLLADQNSDQICRNPSKHIVEDKAQKSTYENCQRNGMTWWYTDTGMIKSEVNFKEGQEHGLYTSYYENGKKTELETFTGYVVKSGKQMGVPTPLNDRIYAALKDK